MNPSKAIEHLIGVGWTEAGIASQVGTTQPTINRIKNGASSPGYKIGEALVRLAVASPKGKPARKAA